MTRHRDEGRARRGHRPDARYEQDARRGHRPDARYEQDARYGHRPDARYEQDARYGHKPDARYEQDARRGHHMPGAPHVPGGHHVPGAPHAAGGHHMRGALRGSRQAFPAGSNLDGGLLGLGEPSQWGDRQCGRHDHPQTSAFLVRRRTGRRGSRDDLRAGHRSGRPWMVHRSCRTAFYCLGQRPVSTRLILNMGA